MFSASALTPHLGVEVTGVIGSELVNPLAAAQCQELLDRHGVVIYREVQIADDDLISFSRLLGEVVVAPTGEHQRPEIQVISMDPEKANPNFVAYRKGNFLWHFDGAGDPLPQKATLLSAQAVDEAGAGGTEFASTYLAYETLSADDKAMIDGLQVDHSFANAQARANPHPTDRERSLWARVAPRIHPLVWTRRDGRKSLLLGATSGTVVGWPAEQGHALLERLEHWATRPEVVLRQDWRQGDLVIWDNTGMLHRALPFEPTSRRLLHRTTLVGVEHVA